MKRIKYVSRFARTMSHAEIDALTEQSQRNNARLDITGILMTTGKLFFQMLEGPREHVDTVFQKILADERHTDVLLLSADDQVQDRIFPEWSMQKVDLDEETNRRLEPIREILETIVETRIRLEKLTNALERAVWHELSTPG